MAINHEIPFDGTIDAEIAPVCHAAACDDCLIPLEDCAEYQQFLNECAERISPQNYKTVGVQLKAVN